MIDPYIYNCDKSIDVYKESLDFLTETKKIDDISELGWVYNSIGDLIPHTTQNLWSGHIFPWTESWDELQISFNQSILGFYKQSMISLRIGLELGLLSVYWNLNDDGHKTIKMWISSREETPRLPEIWNKLEKHSNFKSFQKLYDIKYRLLQLKYFHDYVHSRGFKYSNRFGKKQVNSQCFEKDLIERWLISYKEVITVLAILHLIKYPIGTIKYNYSNKFGIDTPSFGGLQIFEIERIEKLIGIEVFEKLEIVAQEDENVTSLLIWIENKPNITEEEVENQIIEQDKSMIEHMGLNEWLKQEIKLFEKNHRIKMTEKHKKRIESLKIWAKEKGYDVK